MTLFAHIYNTPSILRRSDTKLDFYVKVSYFFLYFGHLSRSFQQILNRDTENCIQLFWRSIPVPLPQLLFAQHVVHCARWFCEDGRRPRRIIFMKVSCSKYEG